MGKEKLTKYEKYKLWLDFFRNLGVLGGAIFFAYWLLMFN